MTQFMVESHVHLRGFGREILLSVKIGEKCPHCSQVLYIFIAEGTQLLQSFLLFLSLVFTNEVQESIERYSILRLRFEHLPQYVSGLIRHLSFSFPRISPLDGFNKRSCVSSFERHHPVQHLIKYRTRTVNVHLLVVKLPFEDLWSHVQGSPCEGSHHLVFRKFGCESKICYFYSSMVQQDIGGFEIAMHDFELMHGGNASYDLPEYFDGL